MHDTLPPILSVWSGPAAPLCCLANKSQARQCSESLQSALEANLNGPGSMIYQNVWKPHTTPLGRQIYRLRASARRTSDNEPSLVRSGWATPVGQQANGTPDAFLERKRKSMANGSQSMGVCLSDLNMQVQAWAGWPSPTVGNAAGSQMAKGASTTGRRPDGSKATVSLNAVAQASGWNTPRATDGSNGGPNQAGGALTPDAALSGWRTPMASDTQERKSVGYIERRKNRKFSITTAMEAVWQLSGWPTPRANDAEKRGAVADDPRNGLVTAGNLSGWPTPMAADNRDRGSWDDPAIQRRKRIGKSIELSMLVGCAHGAARITADGTMLTGCSAGMESGGQLNPAFSGWLMGFPEAWCHAAISCQLPARLRKAPKRPVA